MYRRVLDIKPSHATAYPIYMLDRRQSMFHKPPIRNSTQALSAESRKVLMNAVNWLLLFSPEKRFYCDVRKRWLTFRINFITLTLACAQSENDEYIKNRLLQPFLKWLIRKGATAYIWKAETQNNGNIHFHITTNQYIHWSLIREKWNGLQNAHGFLDNYKEQHESSNPNSTDIHGVKKHADLLNNIGNYFGKIDEWCRGKGKKMEKEMVTHPSKWFNNCAQLSSKFPVPKRQVNGRKWSVSNNLTSIKCFVDDEILSGVDFENVMTDFVNNTEHELISRDFADIYCYNEQKLFSNIHPLVLDMLSDCYNDFVINSPKA